MNQVTDTNIINEAIRLSEEYPKESVMLWIRIRRNDEPPMQFLSAVETVEGADFRSSAWFSAPAHAVEDLIAIVGDRDKRRIQELDAKIKAMREELQKLEEQARRV